MVRVRLALISATHGILVMMQVWKPAVGQRHLAPTVDPGAKRVTLTVRTTGTTLTHSDYVTINVEPVAKAGSDQTVGVGDTVSFNGSGSIGTNLSYSWDFGDNATSGNPSLGQRHLAPTVRPVPRGLP